VRVVDVSVEALPPDIFAVLNVEGVTTHFCFVYFLTREHHSGRFDSLHSTSIRTQLSAERKRHCGYNGTFQA
jgi:hypothetical protein